MPDDPRAFPSSEPGTLDGIEGMRLSDWIAGRVLGAIAEKNDSPAQIQGKVDKAYAFAAIVIATRPG